MPCSGSPCRKTRCAAVAGWKVMGIMGACVGGRGQGKCCVCEVVCVWKGHLAKKASWRRD